jgi:DNA-binding GntR family transcriptional regulator
MTEVIRPIERPVPLRQTVYDALVELIVNGVLQPGQRMVEAELARRLGVSRQPIREAFHRLQAEGWVDLRPGQGAFVHTPTDTEVSQLLDVRALLESEAARLAAGAATPEQVASLRDIWKGGVDAIEAADPERIVAANGRFHAQVRAISGNVVLAELIGLVDRRVRWYHRQVAQARGLESWNEHAEIIDAIEAGDGDAAAAVARRHTEHTKRAYMAAAEGGHGPGGPGTP